MKTHIDKTILLCCFIPLISIFTIIGLPLWLVGCNPHLSGGCLTSNIESLLLLSKYQQPDICERCIRGGWMGSSYTCRNESCIIMTLNFVNSNNVSTCFVSEKLNPKFYDSYQINKTYHILISKVDQSCDYDIDSSLNKWISGIVFLSLTGLLILLFLVLLYFAIKQSAPTCSI